MSIYINKNDQQSGPHEDHVVIDELRSGRLTSDDRAIRHGESKWQRLGDMFPDVVPTPSPSQVSAEPAAKSGCRKMLGWTMLAFGLLLMLGGVGAAGFNRTIDHPLCQDADRYEREVNEAKLEVDTARDPVRAAEALGKMNDKLARLKIKTESCGDMIDYYRWWFFALLGIGTLGLMTAVVGFFVRRV